MSSPTQSPVQAPPPPPPPQSPSFVGGISTGITNHAAEIIGTSPLLSRLPGMQRVGRPPVVATGAAPSTPPAATAAAVSPAVQSPRSPRAPPMPTRQITSASGVLAALMDPGRSHSDRQYAETVVRGYVQSKMSRKKGKNDVASKLDAVEWKLPQYKSVFRNVRNEFGLPSCSPAPERATSPGRSRSPAGRSTSPGASTSCTPASPNVHPAILARPGVHRTDTGSSDDFDMPPRYEDAGRDTPVSPVSPGMTVTGGSPLPSPVPPFAALPPAVTASPPTSRPSSPPNLTVPSRPGSPPVRPGTQRTASGPVPTISVQALFHPPMVRPGPGSQSPTSPNDLEARLVQAEVARAQADRARRDGEAARREGEIAKREAEAASREAEAARREAALAARERDLSRHLEEAEQGRRRAEDARRDLERRLADMEYELSLLRPPHRRAVSAPSSEWAESSPEPVTPEAKEV
ncbi:hypothetical protein Q8F55_008214 [Vanrija albida]|uniref:Uncharacterized protein n=1 Tax=Vanrija albida TaxID=181172 RepID=A0ABR3PVQ4_9TREE